MRRARFPRAGLALLLTGLTASTGCTHNYYYGNAVPVCTPGAVVVPGAAPYGSVCEVPTQVGGGTVVAQGPVRSTVIGPMPPRVVVSEPGTRPRFGWQRSDPESGLATTRVEGAIDEPTISR